MAIEITLPPLGENLTSGEVLDVKVKPGDLVSAGQPLLEVEAEKSTVEVPAPVTGRMVQVLVRKGDVVQVGQVLGTLDGAETAEAGARAPASEQAAPAATAAETSRETPAPAPLVIAPARAAAGSPRAVDGTPSDRPVAAGPATRQLARELGVDLRLVVGTGPHGRITPDDVKAYVRQLAGGAVPVAAGTGISVPPLPDFARWGPIDRQPLDPVRRRTAEQMSLSWSQVPRVTHYDQADITDLEAFRREHAAKGEPRLTVTAFALKAVAVVLKEYPRFNASLDPAAGQLILKRYYHIGVAVDTEHGLLVPVVRDVDQKSVRDLAQELAELADRARQKKLSVDEMRGGTFTITNLGGIGGT
ncbi:MAG: 2-oxo acid dehydrogenase subunit E2, partial [Gemmataceae bacterium]|nr:2-oxo acid dehydrogenase subunit E2 [Gemmataceae bacterium]